MSLYTIKCVKNTQELLLAIVVEKTDSRSLVFITDEKLVGELKHTKTDWLRRTTDTRYESKLSGFQTARGIRLLYSRLSR